MTKARAVRKFARALAVLACVVAGSFLLSAKALADGGPQIATATTQDLLNPVPGLSIVWHRKPVSALPFRIRLLNQASPLAYSLDINRPAAYSDSWTGISLGQPTDAQARSRSSTGVNNPLIAEAIARGDTPSGQPIPPATSAELAARQVAIWASTNNIALTQQTVPNSALRTRGRQLLAGAENIEVPLQAASHSIQISVQDTTANTVKLAVTIGIDANTHPTAAQHIDLYLDGIRCPIQTQALTPVELRSNGTYHASKPHPLDPKIYSTDVAEVDLHRNTEVVDATANWVNVISEPGLIMVGADAAPPLVTAEPAVLNFTSTRQLNPSDYASPQQLLNNAGVDFLTTVPGWAVWFILLPALYLITRIGRLLDTAWAAALRQLSRPKPKATVQPATVEVEATTEDEAIAVGLLALNLTTPDDVVIKIVQKSANHLLPTLIPARVSLTRQLKPHS